MQSYKLFCFYDVSEYYEKNSVLFNPAEKSIGEVAVSAVSEKNTEHSSGKFELFEFMDKWLEYKKPRVSRLTYDEYCSILWIEKMRDTQFAVGFG